MLNGEGSIEEDRRRLFFAFHVAAVWPDELPKGRILDAAQRHLTVAFLGEVDYAKLKACMSSMPTPKFKVGPCGVFDKILFLPKAHPRVVAWHVKWFNGADCVANYHRELVFWLQEAGFVPDVRADFLPHVSICRSPFSFHDWREAFSKIPMYISGLHLYESVGGLQYKSLWEHELTPPFIELEHTADIAFEVYGENVSQVFYNAFSALAWKFPELLSYREECWEAATVEDIVRKLNAITGRADAEKGCPFKAVSYHGEIEKTPKGVLKWEMIVDV